jgi:hypothetical protein
MGEQGWKATYWVDVGDVVEAQLDWSVETALAPVFHEGAVAVRVA